MQQRNSRSASGSARRGGGTWRGTAVAAIAVLLGTACADDPVAPARGERVAPSVVLRGAQGGDTTVIRVKRVTDLVVVDAGGRQRPKHSVENFTRRAQLLVAHRGASPRAAKARAFDPDHPPLPELTVPAGAPSLIASSVPWTKSIPASSADAMAIEMQGIGDAPASRTVISLQGRPIFVVTQQWQRGAQAWQLLSREVLSTDGSYHEVVTVDWGRSAARPSLTTLFADATEPSVLFDGTRYRADDDVCDPCRDKVDAVTNAGAVAMAAVLTSAASCGAVVIARQWAQAQACIASINAAALAVLAFENAKDARNACWAAPPPCPKPCDAYASVRTMALRATPDAAPGGVAVTRRKQLCDGGTGTTSGTSGGFADDSYNPTLYGGDRVCDIWIAYDQDTGKIEQVVILHCYAAQ